jgi:hypothetical protein
MVLMGYSGARGTLIFEINLKSKISCQTPFKQICSAYLHIFKKIQVLMYSVVSEPHGLKSRVKLWTLPKLHG